MTVELTRGWHQRGTGTRPDDFGDNFFVHEIMTQCWFVEATFAQMREIYAHAPTGLGLQAMAHSLLVFASNIAKLLTPPARKDASEKRKRRAIRLQGLLNCEQYDFSAIVNARNYLEHFDERMDRFIGAEELGGALLLRCVSNDTSEFVQLGGDKFKACYLQHLNTSTLELTMVDETIRLSTVVEQAMEIGARAAAWIDAKRDPDPVTES
jgi:hypothetical protein